MAKINSLLKNPYKIFSHFASRGWFDSINDKRYLKLMFRARMGKKLDLNNPKTFNEKLQWLKLYDRDPRYTQMVDKYEAKKYVADIIGMNYIIPSYGVWDCFSDIDFDKLPFQFVLKCTHDSGGLVICKDKNKFDYDTARDKIENTLKRNYYLHGREWPYKNVKPRIIAEKYMIDNKLHELRDYKFFCFNGYVKFFKVDFNRFSHHRANYYDVNCNLMDFGEAYYPPDPQKNILLPQTIYTMMQLAEQLASGISFLRVDFYDVDGNIYFGEMTFYPASGFGPFTPEESDLKLGKLLKLPTK